MKSVAVLPSAYNIFDDYLADGNTATDFITVLLEIYKVSGLIQQDKVTEKNA